MAVNQSELDNFIAGFKPPKIGPFRVRVKECPKCGCSSSRTPPFLANFLNLYSPQFLMSYCPGSQDAQKTITMGGVFPMQAEVTMDCAGILREHLHLACRRCHYRWIQAVKSE